MEKPRLFIGSSVEGLPVARAIKAELDYDMEVTVWSQGVFKLSHSHLEDLSVVLENSDFASFVFLPEDKLEIRGEEKTTVRDNVVFELGLFYGKLGRDKVSYIMPRGYDLHLPSDLTGVTGGTFEYPNTNMQASVGIYCDQIRDQISMSKVIFPSHCDFGNNILHHDITSSQGTASFTAIIPNGKKIIVRIEDINKKGLPYVFDVANTGKWRIGIIPSPNNNTQFIQGTGPFDEDTCFRILGESDINIQIFEDNLNNPPIMNKNVHIAPSI